MISLNPNKPAIAVLVVAGLLPLLLGLEEEEEEEEEEEGLFPAFPLTTAAGNFFLGGERLPLEISVVAGVANEGVTEGCPPVDVLLLREYRLLVPIATE